VIEHTFESFEGGVEVTKRYREQLEEVECDGDRPQAFAWRGQRYQVVQVLGHWREDPGWWRRANGGPVRIEQSDLWRVEARHRAGPGGRKSNGASAGRGVYELVCHGGAWRLDRIWD
jgi:hypothetical protein